MDIPDQLPSTHEENPFLDKIDKLRSVQLERIAKIVTGLKGKTEDELIAYAAENQGIVEQGIVEACKIMEVTEITFSANSGIKGAGKDTAITAKHQAILEISANEELLNDTPPLRELVQSLSSNTATITTGTGGIMYKPEKQYASMFGELAEVLKNFEGGYAPDSITDFLVGLVQQATIYQNAQPGEPLEIVHNLWPRTANQIESAQRLVGKLNKAGVRSTIDMTHFVLATPEVVLHMEQNRTEYADELKSLLTQLESSETKALLTSAKASGHEEQLDTVNRLLDSLGSGSGTIRGNLLEEINKSVERSVARYKKAIERSSEPRTDDLPVLSLTRAIKDLGIAVEMLRNPDVKLIAADQSPEDVATAVLIHRLGQQVDFEGDAFKILNTRVREVAHKLVYGEN